MPSKDDNHPLGVWLPYWVENPCPGCGDSTVAMVKLDDSPGNGAYMVVECDVCLHMYAMLIPVE
jgi:transcription elongation factor Elf1